MGQEIDVVCILLYEGIDVQKRNPVIHHAMPTVLWRAAKRSTRTKEDKRTVEMLAFRPWVIDSSHGVVSSPGMSQS
jgi:hypothetical protein